MPKISAKGTLIKVDDINGSPQEIGFDVESYEVPTSVDANEVTGVGDPWHNFVPGMPVFEVTLNCIWNNDSTSGAASVLPKILGSASSKTVSIKPPNGSSMNGEFMLESIKPSGSTKDAVKMGACKFKAMGSTAATWAYKA